MAGIIVFISVSLALLLIFLADVELDLIYYEHFIIKISFILVSFELTIKEIGKQKERKFNLFPSQDDIKTVLKYFFSHSNVKIERLLIFTPDNPPHQFSVRYRNALTVISIFFSLFSMRVRSFSAPPDAVLFISHDGPIKIKDAHAFISAPLYVFIISLLTFLIFGIRQKIKRYRMGRYDLR